MQTKVIFITGASSGIGQCTAQYLAQKGYRVYGTSRKADFEQPVQSFSSGGRFTLIPLDVSDQASIAAAVAFIQEKEQRIDVLVNNAGNGVAAVSYTHLAFAGPQSGRIGFIHGSQVRYTHLPIRLHTTQSVFDVNAFSRLPPVCILYQYAGSEDAFLAQACRDYEGVVLACVGNGSLNASMRNALRSLPQGTIVVRSSRSILGSVAHEEEARDQSTHTIAAGDLSPQKARILLQLCLTKTHDSQQIQTFFDQY